MRCGSRLFLVQGAAFEMRKIRLKIQKRGSFLLLACLLFSLAEDRGMALSGYLEDYHVIRPGDNLRSIARRYRTTVLRLKALNGIESSRLLAGGWLRVKEPRDQKEQIAYRVYRVRRNDTLSRISKVHRVSVSSIKSINGLKSDVIYVGQRLRLLRLGNGKKPLFNSAFAERLAVNALSYGRRSASHGYCLRGVRRALTRTLIQEKRITDPRKLMNLGPHAAYFLRAAERNPRQLCQSLGLADVTYLSSGSDQDLRPDTKGSIYLYNPGKCGFHSMYGHVEVVVDPAKKRACSDHCRTMGPYCKPDLVLAPVKSCDWF